VNSQNLQIFAAVSIPLFAGETILTIDVGLYATTISRLDVGYTLTHRKNFHSQLMPRDAGIAEERHLSQKSADVRSTNTDRMHPNKGFARCGPCRFGKFRPAKLPGLFKQESFHSKIL
jgi:hypothetical protein